MFNKSLILIAVLISITVFTTSSFAIETEFRFRDYKWGLDIVTFKNALQFDIAKVYDTDNILERYRDETAIETVEYMSFLSMNDETHSEFYNQQTNPGFKCFTLSISAKDGVLIAGHPLRSISATALYGVDNGIVYDDPEHSRIVNATYRFDVRETEEPVYYDLKEKLINTYGYPSCEDSLSDGLAYRTIWVGANETYMELLYMKDLSVTLEYGLLDIGSIIYEIEHPESTIDSNNTDGL